MKYVDASIERVTAGNGIEYAYRVLGDGDVPLVLLSTSATTSTTGIPRSSTRSPGIGA